MMNCTPRREMFDPQHANRTVRWQTWLGTSFAVLLLALLWVQPVAAQAVGPVYALPGTLTRAVNRSYDTILTTANGNEYGLAGQTPDIEAQIVQYRGQGADLVVKVWGDRYPATTEDELEVIIVSSIQLDQPVTPTTVPTVAPTTAPTTAPTAAPTATPQPQPTAQPTPALPLAVITVANVNVRGGPSTDYPVIGGLVLGQSCAVIGRNQAATWWQLSCPGDVSGWVFGDILALSGPVANVPVVQTAPPPAPTTFANWKATFFPNLGLAGNPALTLDAPNVNFNWGTGSPGANIPNDNFTARFERTIDFTYGTYNLVVTVDDGVRLFIDDQLIIDQWTMGAARTFSAQQVLSGSKRVRIEYIEYGNDALIQFSANLISSSEAWTASYYYGKGFGSQPILTRGEPRSNSRQLDYNWGRGAPANGIPVDSFSARWLGTFNFEGGDYNFHAISDDGIRVYIDGILILDRWLNGYQGDVNNSFRGLGAGNHQITVEYYESFGDALVSVWWERTSSGGGGGGGGNDNSGRPRDQ